LGNTPSVATAHYLQVLDLDFQKALGGGAVAVQSGAAGNEQETPILSEVPGEVGVVVPTGGSCSVLSDPGSDQEYTRQESNL